MSSELARALAADAQVAVAIKAAMELESVRVEAEHEDDPEWLPEYTSEELEEALEIKEIQTVVLLDSHLRSPRACQAISSAPRRRVWDI